MTRISPSLIPAIAWFILSVILLTLPGSALPEENWMSRIWMFDKWIHIGLFAVLVFLACWGSLRFNPSPDQQRNWFLWIAVWALLYGVGMEFVQGQFISHRSFDVKDIIADAVGCLVGFLFSTGRYIKK